MKTCEGCYVEDQGCVSCSVVFKSDMNAPYTNVQKMSHWLLLSEWMGLNWDVLNSVQSKRNAVAKSLLGRITRYIHMSEERLGRVPVYYIHQEIYTVVAIYRFRPRSLFARLPKDVLKLILYKLWRDK